MAKTWRTVSFVSHNMQSIKTLCPRCILLSQGTLVQDGPASKVVALYNEEVRNAEITADTSIHNPQFRRGSGAARFSKVVVEDANGVQRHDFQMGETVRFDLGYDVKEDINALNVLIALRGGMGNEVITAARGVISKSPIKAGTQANMVLEFPDIALRPGEYPLHFWLGETTSKFHDVVDNLSAPLIISTQKSEDELGFDPAQSMGYFSIPTRRID